MSVIQTNQLHYWTKYRDTRTRCKACLHVSGRYATKVYCEPTLAGPLLIYMDTQVNVRCQICDAKGLQCRKNLNPSESFYQHLRGDFTYVMTGKESDGHYSILYVFEFLEYGLPCCI